MKDRAPVTRSVPAQCTNRNCWRVFESGLIGSLVIGNSMTCPSCGAVATIANAAMHFADGEPPTLMPLDAASASMFQAMGYLGPLRDIVQQASEGTIDVATAVAEAAKLSPQAARVVDWAAICGVLGLLLNLLMFAHDLIHEREQDTRDVERDRISVSREAKHDARQDEFNRRLLASLDQSEQTQRHALKVLRDLELVPSWAKPSNQSAGTPNRHNRRAAASQQRRASH